MDLSIERQNDKNEIITLDSLLTTFKESIKKKIMLDKELMKDPNLYNKI